MKTLLGKIHHITMVENKLSKNVGLLHKAKIYLNKDSMVSLYYSFHSYLFKLLLLKAATQRCSSNKVF